VTLIRNLLSFNPQNILFLSCELRTNISILDSEPKCHAFEYFQTLIKEEYLIKDQRYKLCIVEQDVVKIPVKFDWTRPKDIVLYRITADKFI
jgi:hypothetical protein